MRILLGLLVPRFAVREGKHLSETIISVENWDFANYRPTSVWYVSITKNSEGFDPPAHVWAQVNLTNAVSCLCCETPLTGIMDAGRAGKQEHFSPNQIRPQREGADL
jgi:hypothetical protein